MTFPVFPLNYYIGIQVCKPLYINLCRNLTYCISFVKGGVRTRAFATAVNFGFYEVTEFVDEPQCCQIFMESRGT
jgi:hypothetical protein